MTPRTGALIAAKLAISAGLIAYAFSRVDTASALTLLRAIHPAAIAAALGVLALQQLFGALRLRLLLRQLQAPVGLGTAIDTVFVGLFFGTTAISFISGDAMRVWRLAKAGVPVASGFQAILFDRLFGFVALIATIGLGLPLLFDMTADPAMPLSVMAGTAAGAAAIAVFVMIHRLPAALRRFRPVRIIAETSARAATSVSRPRDVVSLVGVSLLLQALNVMAVYLIGRGLGIDVRPIDLLVVIPPVMLVTMLPVSFAGWGVRESAMVVGLGLLGVAADRSVALSICFGLSMMAVGLPGGVIWFVGRREPAPPVPVVP